MAPNWSPSSGSTTASIFFVVFFSTPPHWWQRKGPPSTKRKRSVGCNTTNKDGRLRLLLVQTGAKRLPSQLGQADNFRSKVGYPDIWAGYNSLYLKEIYLGI